MHLVYPAVLAALLFSVGLYGVLARRNAVLVLISVELMLNAVNLNLVAFDVWLRDTLRAGQSLTLFTIAIAAAEIGIGLAIVLLVYRNRAGSNIDALRDLAERPTDSQERAVPDAAADDADAADVNAAAAPGAGTGAAPGGKQAGATA
ncbi:NADH-quinone oxidoreductase subunit NuoK [Streptomyces sp. JJ66]|uniref:NADH-quinone oxidoreductase subunit NuoK n=1 Tax=Streptomyces sp. JJ66 TaxID=2803843 RepID=UPI001C57A48F|nr:NADH-quinone oxidoreductase subunit NuoK [Streptomyces sp. JJ66]MBW1602551.1 NADH-quinone oxidoreductase subunit NuoK [Streptomyces sp. JJ66]